MTETTTTYSVDPVIDTDGVLKVGLRRERHLSGTRDAYEKGGTIVDVWSNPEAAKRFFEGGVTVANAVIEHHRKQGGGEPCASGQTDTNTSGDSASAPTRLPESPKRPQGPDRTVPPPAVTDL